MARRRVGAGPRVLIIVQNLSVPFDRRVWLECRALIAAGFGVSVICPMGKDDDRYTELEGVRIYRYPPPPAAMGPVGFAWEFAYCFARTAWLALRISRRDGFDAVQACNPPDTFFPLGWVAQRTGRRFVFDQHDLCPELFSSRFPEGKKGLLRLLYLLEKGTYRVADHVISTNESYRGVALRRGGRRPDDVTIVRTGPDADKLRRGDADPALRRGRAHLVAYLGVMGPQDGVDIAVRAAAVLKHEMARTDVSFLLIGGGDMLDELRRLATELDVADIVEFTGRAPDELVARALSTADLGLSPDPKNPLNDVSTMNKTMEYMSFELPVVAFDLVETKVSAGDAAVYAQPNDVKLYAAAIAELLDDPDRRARMGAEGRRRVEDVLAWPHQRDAYVGVYRQLIGSPA